MPKLQAAVPAGAPPNALLRVRLPDGNEVNVRVPEGLKPGDEFIFEVSSIGEITSSSSSTTAIGTRKDNSGSGGGKGEKSNQKKKTPKNPKKNKRSNNPDNDSRSHGRGGGDHHSQQHHHHNHPNNNAGGAPGFVTGFFNMYNQVYDILSHNNTFTPQPTRPSGTNGMGNNSNTARQGNLSRQSSRGNKGSNSNNNNNNNNNNNQNNNNLQSSNNNAPPPSPRPISSQSRPRISASKIETSTSMNTMNNNTGAPLTFLDRELSTPRDFLTALGVGILIGLSIVMGFLAGVLYVTPITKDDSVVQ